MVNGVLHKIREYRVLCLCLLINAGLICWHKSVVRTQTEEEKARLDRLQTMQTALLAFYRPEEKREEKQEEEPQTIEPQFALLTDYQQAGEYKRIRINGDFYERGDYYNGSRIVDIAKTCVFTENGVVYKGTEKQEKREAANPAGV